MAKKSRILEIPAIVPDASGQHIEDAKNLTRTELRIRYATTYRSWDGMKTRCGKEGIQVHPQFEEFPDFLRYVGPRPEGKTLDRILPGKEGGLYEPGNVRWLTPEEQANNRPGTKLLTYDGVTQTLTEWARETGQKPDTLRNRREKGWSDAEVITGRSGRVTHEQRPWDYHDDAAEREKAEKFYLEKRRSGERPFEFCIRYFRAGIKSWDDYFYDSNFYDDDGSDDPFGGIAPHCIPELESAQRMLQRFEPVQRWLEHTWTGLNRVSTAKRPIHSENRTPRPDRGRRGVDPEAAYYDFCESYPELADREEDDTPVERGPHTIT